MVLNCYPMETNQTFVDWLLAVMSDRGMDQAELAKRGNIAAAQVSRVLTGTRGPGLGFLRGVKKATGLPMEDVLRAAKILENRGAPPAIVLEWGEQLKTLSADDQKDVIAAVNLLLQVAQRR